VLELQAVSAGYGRTTVLRDVDLRVGEGEIVTIIGANGAGKSTLLKTVSGVLKPSSGSVTFCGERIDRLGVESIVGRRLVQIPEGRRLFAPLTVQENLALGAYARRRGDRPVKKRLEQVFDLFPRLRERMQQHAGTLSGGEQQMLAVGRALMAKPSLLLLDEPSMGLSPILVEEIFRIIQEINKQGTSILLVEQNAFMALQVATRGYVLETGAIALAGSAAELGNDPKVRAAYLGDVC
jgi:branched-chain amino acid transport system ATP-binding protein